IVWPILISVSVTPGAFSARAPRKPWAEYAAAAAADSNRKRRVIMLCLPIWGVDALRLRRRAALSCAHQFPNRLPVGAVEYRWLQVADRAEVGRRGVDSDARP